MFAPLVANRKGRTSRDRLGTVAIAQRGLDIPRDKLDVNGGATAIGASGARMNVALSPCVTRVDRNAGLQRFASVAANRR